VKANWGECPGLEQAVVSLDGNTVVTWQRVGAAGRGFAPASAAGRVGGAW